MIVPSVYTSVLPHSYNQHGSLADLIDDKQGNRANEEHDRGDNERQQDENGGY